MFSFIDAGDWLVHSFTPWAVPALIHRPDTAPTTPVLKFVVGSRGNQRDVLQGVARPLSRSMSRLQGDDFPVARLRRLLVRLLQLSVKARLAHSACFATVALQEVMTAGRTIEVRAGHRMAV
jgi:hypothetical protein